MNPLQSQLPYQNSILQSLQSIIGGGSSNTPTFSSPSVTDYSVPQQASPLLSYLSNPVQQIPQIPASDFAVPNMQDLIAKAYNALAPYYQKLLTEANGDVTLATQNLQQDYDITTRQANEDLARVTQQTQDTLSGSLAQLGAQQLLDTNSLINSLNQRGIAVTQGQTPTSPLNAATEGEAGTEMQQQITTPYSLRQEALNRAAQQTIQNQQISQQRTQEQAGITQTRGQQALAQQQRTYGENLDTQRQQQAIQQAGINAQQQQAGQQANIQQLQYGNMQQAAGSVQQPNYAPNVVNQTVQYGGATWKGQPNQGWVYQGPG